MKRSRLLSRAADPFRNNGFARDDSNRKSVRAWRVCASIVLLLAAGCDRTLTVRGAVVDVKGAALPGVAVTVDGTEIQTTTDGVGKYVLRCAAGPVELDFIKTGYTRGRLSVPATGSRTLEVTEVMLWPVPPHQGVYLFADYRYNEASRTEAKRYLEKDRGPVFATKQVPELETEDPNPLLISIRLPAYDVSLYRLEEIEAALPSLSRLGVTAPTDEEKEGYSYAERVWAPSGAIAVIAVPIDEPEGQLLELRLGRPLSPGVYAIHWGALDGHTTTDPRIFLFRVAEPPPEEKPDSGEPDSGEPDSGEADSG